MIKKPVWLIIKAINNIHQLKIRRKILESYNNFKFLLIKNLINLPNLLVSELNHWGNYDHKSVLLCKYIAINTLSITNKKLIADILIKYISDNRFNG